PALTRPHGKGQSSAGGNHDEPRWTRCPGGQPHPEEKELMFLQAVAAERVAPLDLSDPGPEQVTDTRRSRFGTRRTQERLNVWTPLRALQRSATARVGPRHIRSASDQGSDDLELALFAGVGERRDSSRPVSMRVSTGLHEQINHLDRDD